MIQTILCISTSAAYSNETHRCTVTSAAEPVKNAVPSWSQKIPDTKKRFELVLFNTGELNGKPIIVPTAVYDRETGLVWELAPDAAEVIWSVAKTICYNKIRGERKGWRLSTIEEVSSLVDPTAIGNRRNGNILNWRKKLITM